MYHDAYSYAVKIWKSLNYGDSISDTEYAQLRNLVSRYIAHEYPAVPATARSSAVSYGIDSAARDLTNPDVGGLPGFVGNVVGSVGDAIEGDVAAVEGAARSALNAAESAIRTALAAIVHAVGLPRAALPAKVPTSIADAYTTLGHELGSLSPTRLARANKTRATMRRLGR